MLNQLSWKAQAKKKKKTLRKHHLIPSSLHWSHIGKTECVLLVVNLQSSTCFPPQNQSQPETQMHQFMNSSVSQKKKKNKKLVGGFSSSSSSSLEDEAWKCNIQILSPSWNTGNEHTRWNATWLQEEREILRLWECQLGNPIIEFEQIQNNPPVSLK